MPMDVDYKVLVVGVSIGKVFVPGVFLDGGSGVNIIPETTCKRLTLLDWDPAPFQVKMADQRRVQPLGILRNLLISVGGLQFVANFVVLRLEESTCSYPLMLGRPWLRAARVKQLWGADAIVIKRGKKKVKMQMDAKKHPEEAPLSFWFLNISPSAEFYFFLLQVACIFTESLAFLFESLSENVSFVQLSGEAVKDIRVLVAERYGDKYVPAEYRRFKSKVKNAQEAHEAIRPTDVYCLPSQLVHLLEKDALLLYTLIWKRTVACQMEQAVYEKAVVNIVTEDGSICLQGGSSILSFPGFLAAMEDNHGMKATAEVVVEGESDHEENEVGQNPNIFSLKKDDALFVQKAEALQHFTRSPARFSEGILVKAMEELGIGRPSTYAIMLKTLESRGYVEIEHHRIIPKARGQMVATFLSQYFAKYIDYDFTAHVEAQLDEVSGGRVEWKEVLRSFWPEFENVVATSMKVQVSEVIDMLQQRLSSHCFKSLGISGQTCPSCEQGKLTLKLSRYGSG
ncbi:hypothetical protein L7F22_026028 [Adiantum nelumboides]|nr:hypothetical protein [Adiantum nelumboides]